MVGHLNFFVNMAPGIEFEVNDREGAIAGLALWLVMTAFAVETDIDLDRVRAMGGSAAATVAVLVDVDVDFDDAAVVVVFGLTVARVGRPVSARAATRGFELSLPALEVLESEDFSLPRLTLLLKPSHFTSVDSLVGCRILAGGTGRFSALVL